MSPSAPAGRPIRKVGSVVAVCTSETVSAVPPSETISHWAPTVCIHVPTFETVWAIQRARKAGCRSGAQAFTLGRRPIVEAARRSHQMGRRPIVDAARLLSSSREQLLELSRIAYRPPARELLADVGAGRIPACQQRDSLARIRIRRLDPILRDVTPSIRGTLRLDACEHD